MTASRPANTLQSQLGAALVTTLFALVLLTLIGLGITAIGVVAVTTAGNEREATEALYIADSGISHARGLISGLNLVNFNALLVAGNAIPCDGDELSAVPTNPIMATAAGGHPYGSGRYEVRICDDTESDGNLSVDTNGRVVVTSTGYAQNGSAAVIEMLIGTVDLPALMTNGNLRINGNPSIQGTGGIAHSNGDLDIDGNPCAEQSFRAVGDIFDADHAATGPSCTRPGPNVFDSQGVISVPVLNLADLKPQADYILGGDGVIRNQAGVDITAIVPDWSWDSGNRRWAAGNDILPGTYYADNNPGGLTNIEVSGNPGNQGNDPPIALTLIATGWIDISGNPETFPDLSITGTAYSMVAGTDLRISGNPQNVSAGLHYAGHQLNISGNPNILGQVMAADLDDTGTPTNKVVRQSGGYMSISGNATITYNKGSGSFTLSTLGWREVRQ